MITLKVKYDPKRTPEDVLFKARRLLERSGVESELSTPKNVNGMDHLIVYAGAVPLGEGLGGLFRVLSNYVNPSDLQSIFNGIEQEWEEEQKSRLVKPEEVTTSYASMGRPDDKSRYVELALERDLISGKGEFVLNGSGIVLNPAGLGYYYFTSEEAARNYFDLFYTNAQYTIWLLRKVKKLNDTGTLA